LWTTLLGIEIAKKGTNTTDFSTTLIATLLGDARTKEETMTKKPGPSKEYRDLLKGRISPEEYVKQLKRDVNDRVSLRPSSRRAAAT
jgi:hypothetical protein